MFLTPKARPPLFHPAPRAGRKEAELKAGSVGTGGGLGKYKTEVDEREVGNIHIFVLKITSPV
ncbi:MAG: hypothetical protein R3D26_23560 [Cyanobacteriota/Melainabacteria group bacterium]